MFDWFSIFLTYSHEKKNSFILSTQTRARHTHRHTQMKLRHKHIWKLYEQVRITSVGNNRDTFDMSQRELPDISDMTSWKLWKFSKSNRNRVPKREITGNFRHDWSKTEELFRSDRRWSEWNSFQPKMKIDWIRITSKIIWKVNVGPICGCRSQSLKEDTKKKKKSIRNTFSIEQIWAFRKKNILMRVSDFLKMKNIALLICDSLCGRMVKHTGIYHTVTQWMVSAAKHIRYQSDCTFSFFI